MISEPVRRPVAFSSGTPLRRGEQGQVIILFALMSILFIGLLALAVDVGYLMSERREAQAAADSAALAAAVAAMNQAPSSEVTNTAISYAVENANVSDDGVEVHHPPASGPFAGRADYYQVIVTQDVERFFLGAVYTGDWRVSASAVAAVEVEGFATGLIALNPDGGGINTAGDSTIVVEGASVISNWKIRVSGSTTIEAGQAISANDGIVREGSWTFDAPRVNENAPEMPDPLLDKIDPPTLAPFPGNIVPNASGPGRACYKKPDWWPPPQPADYIAPPGGVYSGGDGRCVTIEGAGNTDYVFPKAQYKFTGGAGLNLPYTHVRIDGGTWNFEGGPGIDINGTTHYFEMREGYYSFTNGATIKIGGSAPNNILGGGGTEASDSTFYFKGGGGIVAGGSNGVTLYPGSYIFDGGPGLRMSGSSVLKFMPGTYEFWFNNGADMWFDGSSRIETSDDVWVKMSFYGSDSNTSDLHMQGSTHFNIPSGEYYFDRGQMRNSGSSKIHGEDVFLYFKNGSFLHSSGSAGFSFTAPDWKIYPGYYPGVYMYSDRDNTATFRWDGSSSSASEGIVYLPSSPLHRTGASYGMQWRGQLIVDSLHLSGSNFTGVEYVEYVDTEMPAVYLVE